MPLKKILPSISKQYKMPYLYLDELVQIEEAIKEAEPKEYKITVGNYEYENINEIPRDIGTVYELMFLSHDPCIYVIFGKDYATIRIDKSDVVSLGVFSKIDQILTKSERKFWLAAPYSALWFCIFLCTLGLSNVLFIMILKQSVLGVSICSPIVVILGLYTIISYLNARKFCVIETVPEKNKRVSFFKRNWEQLILISVGAIIGALATFLLERFLLKR